MKIKTQCYRRSLITLQKEVLIDVIQLESPDKWVITWGSVGVKKNGLGSFSLVSHRRTIV